MIFLLGDLLICGIPSAILCVLAVAAGAPVEGAIIAWVVLTGGGALVLLFMQGAHSEGRMGE